MKYNYYEAVKADIRQYIEDNGINANDYESMTAMHEELSETLWCEDSVTGNASGSYTFNRWQAAENIAHNWDLIKAAVWEFGCDTENILDKGEEWCDVTIRCYLLNECLAEVIYEMFPELKAC